MLENEKAIVSIVVNKAFPVEYINPDAVRSDKYHVAGLARARVSDNCSDDCQGNRLWFINQ